jgi:hypothetical protein
VRERKLTSERVARPTHGSIQSWLRQNRARVLALGAKRDVRMIADCAMRGGKGHKESPKPLGVEVLTFASPNPDGMRSVKVANSGLMCSTLGVAAGKPVHHMMVFE